MKQNNQRAFTLIEILLAISILATVTSLIYSSYISTIKTADQNREKSEEYQTARLALKKISQELTGAILAKKDPDKETAFLFTGESDKLFFTTAMPRWLKKDSKEREICEIEYSLVKKPDGVKSSLQRKEDPITDGTMEGEAFELVETVNDILFTYYTEDGTENEEWNSGDQEDSAGRRLPKAVKATLIFGNEENNTRSYSVLTAIPSDW